MLGLLSLIFLGGCASTAKNPRDPLEPLNRAVYQLNDGLDKVILKPVATVYKTVLPQFVRTGVTNFYNNLYDVLTALNNLLQGKVGDAVSDVGRIAINSTVGLAGFIDVATEVGLEKHKETSARRSAAGHRVRTYLQIRSSAPAPSATAWVPGWTSSSIRSASSGAITCARATWCGDST